MLLEAVFADKVVGLAFALAGIPATCGVGAGLGEYLGIAVEDRLDESASVDTRGC